LLEFLNCMHLRYQFRNVAFVSGAVFAVLSLLAIYDEDVLTIEHVLLLITVLGAVMAVCRYVDDCFYYGTRRFN
jgi:hypothetical protein